MALPFIGTGISLISGAIDNLFTGEGRARRQARRLERRTRRAEKQAAKIGVKLPGKVPLDIIEAARERGTMGPRVDDVSGAKVRKPAGMWLEQNWYFVAGGAVALVAILWLALGKKKK